METFTPLPAGHIYAEPQSYPGEPVLVAVVLRYHHTQVSPDLKAPADIYDATCLAFPLDPSRGPGRGLLTIPRGGSRAWFDSPADA